MIATSAYLAEEAIAEGTDGKPDPELWREAGIDELVGALRSAILEPEQREQARALLAEIGDALRLLAAPDLARLRAAEQDERPRTEALAELKRLHALNVRSDLNSRLTTEYPRFPVLLKKELLSAFNRLEDHIQSGASNLRETVPGETTKEVNGAWGATMRPLRSFITAKAAEVGLNIEVELPAIGLPGAQPDPELPPDPNLTGKGSRFISRLWKAVMKVIIDPIAGPPLALAELGFDTKAAREIRDRGTAITYIRRERDRMLVLLPEELRSNYLSLFERAAADLEATRAERIGALEQVEAAVASPPTPEELERSRERMAELRALDERVRAAAGRV
jgi:hypothetical protein